MSEEISSEPSLSEIGAALRSIKLAYEKNLALYDEKRKNLSNYIVELKQVLEKPIELRDIKEVKAKVLGAYAQVYDLIGFKSKLYVIMASQIADKRLKDLAKKMNDLLQDSVSLRVQNTFSDVYDKLEMMPKNYSNKLEANILEYLMERI
jgi:hypothetical protein